MSKLANVPDQRSCFPEEWMSEERHLHEIIISARAGAGVSIFETGGDRQGGRAGRWGMIKCIFEIHA